MPKSRNGHCRNNNNDTGKTNTSPAMVTPVRSRSASASQRRVGGVVAARIGAGVVVTRPKIASRPENVIGVCPRDDGNSWDDGLTTLYFLVCPAKMTGYLEERCDRSPEPF